MKKHIKLCLVALVALVVVAGCYPLPAPTPAPPVPLPTEVMPHRCWRGPPR